MNANEIEKSFKTIDHQILSTINKHIHHTNFSFYDLQDIYGLENEIVEILNGYKQIEHFFLWKYHPSLFEQAKQYNLSLVPYYINVSIKFFNHKNHITKTYKLNYV